MNIRQKSKIFAIDTIILEEYKKNATLTNKKFCDIVSYHNKIISIVKDNDVHTELEYRTDIKDKQEIALAFTRDYVWFDDYFLVIPSRKFYKEQK